jgi:hypothetical protein
MSNFSVSYKELNKLNLQDLIGSINSQNPLNEFSVSMTLTPTQLLNLTPSNSIQILPSPGPAYYYITYYAQSIIFGGTQYSAGTTPNLYYGSSTGTEINSTSLLILTQIENAFGFNSNPGGPYFVQGNIISTYVNQPVVLGLSSGSITNGNSNIYIYIYIYSY